MVPSEMVTVVPRFISIDYDINYNLAGGRLSTPNRPKFTVASSPFTAEFARRFVLKISFGLRVSCLSTGSR